MTAKISWPDLAARRRPPGSGRDRGNDCRRGAPCRPGKPPQAKASAIALATLAAGRD